jgi:hypothetical protein
LDCKGLTLQHSLQNARFVSSAHETPLVIKPESL